LRRRTRDPKEFVAVVERFPFREVASRRRTRDPKEFVAVYPNACKDGRAFVAAPVIPKSLWRSTMIAGRHCSTRRRTRDPKEFVAESDVCL